MSARSRCKRRRPSLLGLAGSEMLHDVAKLHVALQCGTFRVLGSALWTGVSFGGVLGVHHGSDATLAEAVATPQGDRLRVKLEADGAVEFFFEVGGRHWGR